MSILYIDLLTLFIHNYSLDNYNYVTLSLIALHVKSAACITIMSMTCTTLFCANHSVNSTIIT